MFKIGDQVSKVNRYNGWNRPLLVTLTETSNPYLKGRLPMRGLLQVHEMRTDAYAQPTKMSFLPVDMNGVPTGSTVMVEDAQFWYGGVGS